MMRAARNLASSAARLVIAFFLLAAPVLAQQEAKPRLEDSPTGQIFRWINFVLVVVIIVYLGRKAKVPAIFPGSRGRNLAENRGRRARARSGGKARAPRPRPRSRVLARKSRRCAWKPSAPPSGGRTRQGAGQDGSGSDRAGGAGGNRRGGTRGAPGIEGARRAAGGRARRSAAAAAVAAENGSRSLPEVHPGAGDADRAAATVGNLERLREQALNGAVSSRYAAALADVALDQKNADRVKRDLASFAEAFGQSADLRNALESPAVSREAKLQVIRKARRAMDLVPPVRNFLCVLVDHRRTEMLFEIQEAFRVDLNARQNIAEATVTSARALGADERKKLVEMLEEANEEKDRSAVSRGRIAGGRRRRARRFNGVRRFGSRAARPHARTAWNRNRSHGWRISRQTKSQRSCASRSKTTSRRSRSRKSARSSRSVTASRAFTGWTAACPARCWNSRTACSASR